MSLANKSRYEKEFETLRRQMGKELTNLFCYIRLYIHLNDLINEYEKEINVSSAFFRITFKALWNSIVIGISRMIIDRGKKRATLNHYLQWTERHRGLFTVQAKQVRKGLTEDSWVIKESSDLTITNITDYKREVQTLVDKFSSIKEIRDG